MSLIFLLTLACLMKLNKRNRFTSYTIYKLWFLFRCRGNKSTKKRTFQGAGPSIFGIISGVWSVVPKHWAWRHVRGDLKRRRLCPTETYILPQERPTSPRTDRDIYRLIFVWQRLLLCPEFLLRGRFVPYSFLFRNTNKNESVLR